MIEVCENGDPFPGYQGVSHQPTISYGCAWFKGQGVVEERGFKGGFYGRPNLRPRSTDKISITGDRSAVVFCAVRMSYEISINHRSLGVFSPYNIRDTSLALVP